MRQLRTIPELGCNLIQTLRTQIHTDGLAGERNMTRPKATHNNTTATKGVKKGKQTGNRQLNNYIRWFECQSTADVTGGKTAIGTVHLPGSE